MHSVIRVSTIAEILKIWSKIFIKKTPKLHFIRWVFTFFTQLWPFLLFFQTFSLKKIYKKWSGHNSCAWLVNTRQWKMSFSMPNCLKRLEWKMDEKPPLLLPLGEMRKWDVFSSEEEWKIIAAHWNSWSKICPKLLTDLTVNFCLIRESKGYYILRENSECNITKN